MVESYRPSSLAEALEIRMKTGALPFAGGTDLMVRHRAKNGMAPSIDGPVLFVDALKELRTLVLTPEYLRIGASLPLAVIADDPGERVAFAEVGVSPGGGISQAASSGAAEAAVFPGKGAFPGGGGQPAAYSAGVSAALDAIPEVLRRAAADLGAPALRQRATMAGNVANASPAGDTLAALYSLNALVVLGSAGGSRTVTVADFVTGPGKTLLAGDELITEILIPRPLPHWCYWRKVGTRRANALTKVSLSAAAIFSNQTGRGASAHGGSARNETAIDGSAAAGSAGDGSAAAGGLITSFTLAFGAVGPVVVRSPRAEALIIGRKPMELAGMDSAALCALSAEMADAAAADIKPIDDQRSTAGYRKTVALNLIGDALSSLASYLQL